jgi:hypothetical protein
MIGRNKNKNMLEQKPKEQKHILEQIQNHIGTTLCDCMEHKSKHIGTKKMF